MALPSYLKKLLNSERVQIASHLLNKESQIRSTGSVSLDWCTGGGIPKGELVMFWGPPGSGKTTLALKLLAQELRLNPTQWAIWIDTEYGFSAQRAKLFGVDIERVVVLSSNTFEGAIAPLAKMEKEILENKDCCCIILDSVKALTSINEQGQMEEGNVSSAANSYGGIAKSVNPALNILNRLANECNILTLLTNHAQMNMDTMTSKYSPYVLTGGQKLKHLCSTIVFLDKPSRKDSKLLDETLKDMGGNAISVGNLVKAKVTKTRLTVEGKTAEFFMNGETGELAKQSHELIQLGKALGVIYLRGSTHCFGPEQIAIKANGIEAFAKLLDDKNLYNKILATCKEVRLNTSVIVDAEIIDAEVEK